MIPCARRWRGWLLATVLIAGIIQVPGKAGSAEAEPADKPRPTVLTEEQTSVKAVKSGERVEVTAKRSERSTTYALPNGRFEVTEHTRPVRVRQRNGWVKPDATLDRTNGVIAPRASTMDLRFSAGGDGPLASMVRNGHRLEFGWPAKLPAPRLEGDTAIYPEIAKGVDLRLRADTDGFSHLLEVKTPEAARNPWLSRFALGLKTSGLSVRAGSGKELTAVDAGGRGVFEAPAPLMWDSSSTTSTRDRRPQDARRGPPDGSRHAQVRIELDSKAKRMTLVPDQTLLRAADTKFPVFIDPVWKTTTPSSWAMVSSGFPDESYWKFDGKETEGVGRCEVDKDYRCVRTQTKRVYYRMRMPAISKATVLNAVFTAFNTDSYNCSDNRTVRLYRTEKLSHPATWNNRSGQWQDYLDSREVSYCSKTPVEFSSSDLKANVASAAKDKRATITFMLKAYDESSMAWWKRFHEDAALSIQYNHPPNQPKQTSLKFSPGGDCVYKDKAPWINKLADMRAILTDPDSEDRSKVQGQFELSWATKADGSDWGAKWTAPKTDAKTTGSTFTMKMPSTLPKKTLIAWAVRAWDSHQWGPWSWYGKQTACYFYFDDSIPAEPTVTSAMYPTDDNWHGGVGDAGGFTISDSAKAASKYTVRINGGNPIEVPTTDGAPQTVHLAPDQYGANILTVQSFTRANQNSASMNYTFKAGDGRTPRARFGLDEQSGSTGVSGASSGDVTATVHDESVSLGADGVIGKAMKLSDRSRNGYATTSTPVITDPSKSFAVSAWAKYDGDPGQYAAVFSQDSQKFPGFVMVYSPATKKWTFGRTASGVTGGNWAMAASLEDAVPGKWTHLLGVYDSATKQLQIYVDGVPGTPRPTPGEGRDPTGPFNIGRSLQDGNPAAHFQGLVDDVRVYEQSLSETDARRLAAKENVSAPARAHWNLDEDAGATQIAGKASDHQANLNGSAQFGQTGASASAVRLGGNGGHFTTTAPVVQTDRSFSVGAWVNLEDKASSRYAVSQFGTSEIGFELGYESVADQWSFRMRTKDERDGPWVNAFSEKHVLTGTWTYLLGVYDSDAKQIQLYVNGVLQATTRNTTPWQARGPFVIGANQWGGSKGSYWKGLIDDIRVYDRVVSVEEAETLVKQRPQLRARWKLNTDGADDSQNGRNLTLDEGAKIDPGASFITGQDAGLQLNGTGAHARTNAAVADHRNSFSVAGWVRIPYELTGKPVTVFAQAGTNKDVFSLAYVPTADPDAIGHWQAQMTNADSGDGKAVMVKHSNAAVDQWMHVAVVYDAINRALSLYVDGHLEEAEDNVSQASNVWGFEANNGGLQVGRSKLDASTGTWPDAIDDVWAYQGALTVEHLAELAAQRELPTNDGPP